MAGYLEPTLGGDADDVPVVAGDDGDSRADLAVYRGGRDQTWSRSFD